MFGLVSQDFTLEEDQVEELEDLLVEKGFKLQERDRGYSFWEGESCSVTVNRVFLNQVYSVKSCIESNDRRMKSL